MRTDIHKPSAIKPEDYSWVSFQYYGGSDLGAILAMKAERERLAAHMQSTGGKFSQHEHGGLCHVCGQGNISYASVFYHSPSNSYIITGEDCARNIESHDMSAFRRAISNALEAQAGKKKAAATLEAAGLSAAWTLYVAEYNPAFEYEERTIRDIVSKLVKYGSISEKASNYLGVLLGKIAARPSAEEKAAAEAKAAAEHAAIPDVPEGRIQITGTVLGLRSDENAYGIVSRMLVQDDRGFKVWGSRTIFLQKGDRITFKATVTRSDKDSKFGFFKRPTNATVLESQGQAAPQAAEAPAVQEVL